MGNLVLTARGRDDGGGAAVVKLQGFDYGDALSAKHSAMVRGSGLGEFRNGGLIFS
jgi:hypothetical protein